MPATRLDSIPRKTALTIVSFALLLSALPLVPGMKRFGSLKPQYLGELAALPLPKEEAGPAARPVPRAVAPQLAESGLQPADPNLYDPQGALRHFYDSLERVASKEPGSRTVILHYGDSPVTADSITADARAGLQARFGDAGHGFVLLAKPWAWYGHRGIELSSNGWRIEPATQNRAHDGIHGLGGVSFSGSSGAWSEIEIPPGHSRMTIYFLAQPNGGSFALLAGDTELAEISTGGERKQPGFGEYDLPAETRKVRCEVTAGTVRLFGWSFEKNGTGVVYNSLGLNGAQVQAMLRYFEPGQWAEQIQHQNPDLIILNYGTNESVFPDYIEKQYPGELRRILDRIRNAAPNASLLVMSPMDRGVRDASGEIATPEILPRIVEIQKRTALASGWAFFDTYDAMGGAGTMAKWYQAQPRLVSADFMHPLPGGAAKVGKLLDDALLRGYGRYRSNGPVARMVK